MNPIPLRPEACGCPGDRTFKYRTDTRGKTRLACVKCGKPEQAAEPIKFDYEPSP